MTAYYRELTAPAAGAVSVLRIFGPDATAVVDQVFRPLSGLPLSDTEPGRPRVGRVGEGPGDEVVALIDDSSGQAEAEIQCHGGREAVALVAAALEGAGAVRARAEAWARHATGARIEADALLDLALAGTQRAAEILMEQVDGALSSDLNDVLAVWESPQDAIDRIDRLIAHGAVGTRLLSGWSVALAGRPNVGKSSILNLLGGFDRAIVADQPGTTRDVVSLLTAIDGWPVRLLDTAGLRDSNDPIEAAGVDRARTSQAGADLVLLVLDRSVSLEPDDLALLGDHPSALVIANKADLEPAWSADSLGRPVVSLSATSGEGLDELLAAIAGRLVPRVPAAGAGVPFRSRQVERLRAIRSRFADGQADRARWSLARWLAPRH